VPKITARGVCWSTSASPTIADSKTTDGTGTGTFTSSITVLTGNTIYYVRSYSTNSIATSYGNEISFKTSPVLPTVTTTAISDITQTTASSGGNVTSDGGSSITARGVCWSTSASPTTADNKTANGTGSGSFTSAITGLTSGASYYVRAYATNNVGTVYGAEMSFTTYNVDAITDINNNYYKIVTIGTQTWMAENLKTTKYRNGDLIGTTTPATLNIESENTPKYQWAYAGNENNVSTYGRLYTWYAVTDIRNVCPIGWHVPSDAEWTTLTNFLGGESVSGGKLKETGISHWYSPNTGATNETGFTALPGGLRYTLSGTFDSIGTLGYWWSSTESPSTYALDRRMFYNNVNVLRSNYVGERGGFSVRCLKD